VEICDRLVEESAPGGRCDFLVRNVGVPVGSPLEYDDCMGLAPA
jgi:hypothetical protein